MPAFLQKDPSIAALDGGRWLCNGLKKKLKGMVVTGDQGKGMVVPLEQLLEDFYRTMGYDLSTGNPTDSLLAKLDIEK